MKQPLTASGTGGRRRERPAGTSIPGGRPAAGDPPKLTPRRRQNPWIRRALVFATCVLLVDALVGERGLLETLRARQVYREAEASLARMKQENAGLREQIRRLKDDPGTIASVARRELGMITPGEILVVVKDLERADQAR
jgi:cell division protein FtsB